MTPAHPCNCRCETCEAARREARSHFPNNVVYGVATCHVEPFGIIPTPDHRHIMIPGGTFEAVH